MSFNIRREGKEKDAIFLWQDRKKNVLSVINNQHADIIGLQESSPNQIHDIMKNLGDTYGWYGTGRKQQGLIKFFCSSDEYTPIIYNKNRFSLIDGDTFWLNPTMKKYTTGWGALLNRICTWVALKEHINGRIIYIFNTHLDNYTHKARIGGLKLILQQMKLIAGNNPAILMGDLNTPTDIHDIAKILNNNTYQLKHGYHDAQIKKNIVGTARKNVWYGTYQTIDHILFSNNSATWIIHDYHVLWPTNTNMIVSDHAAIICHASLLN